MRYMLSSVEYWAGSETPVLSRLGREASELSQYEVPTEVSLPGFGIGMINEDFHIAGI